MFIVCLEVLAPTKVHEYHIYTRVTNEMRRLKTFLCYGECLDKY